MATREIITHPADILHHKAHKVTDFSPSLSILINDMVDTMRAEPGVGLAAPQIGVSQRVIVVEYGEDEKEEKPPRLYFVVNPEIIRFSEEIELGVEGCLSVPGFAGEVNRSLSVTIKGQNLKGKAIRIKAKGWLARIFQHETDHLNGILFIDRAEKVWKVEEEPEQPLLADKVGLV